MYYKALGEIYSQINCLTPIAAQSRFYYYNRMDNIICTLEVLGFSWLCSSLVSNLQFFNITVIAQKISKKVFHWFHKNIGIEWFVEII